MASPTRGPTRPHCSTKVATPFLELGQHGKCKMRESSAPYLPSLASHHLPVFGPTEKHKDKLLDKNTFPSSKQFPQHSSLSTSTNFTMSEEQQVTPTKAANGAGVPDSVRRNPKRLASSLMETSYTQIDVPSPEVILEEALAPMGQEESEAWEGWVELESEPVSFPTFSSLLLYPCPVPYFLPC